MPLHYVRYDALAVIAVSLLALSYAAERWCCLLSAWLASLLWRSFGELAFFPKLA